MGRENMKMTGKAILLAVLIIFGAGGAHQGFGEEIEGLRLGMDSYAVASIFTMLHSCENGVLTESDDAMYWNAPLYGRSSGITVYFASGKAVCISRAVFDTEAGAGEAPLFERMLADSVASYGRPSFQGAGIAVWNRQDSTVLLKRETQPGQRAVVFNLISK